MNRLGSIYFLYAAWFVALVATLGSLYFSEVLKFPPCNLCWYQRIAMYPLVFILAVGIIRKDKNLPYYVLPLSTTGMLIGIYQNLLYFGILPETTLSCSLGVSCTARYIGYFGFITIPLLSLVSFVLINIFMVIYKKQIKKS